MTVFNDIKDELDNAEWAGSIMLARAVALELCRQGEAAVAMLAALHQDINQFDTLCRLGLITPQQCADCTQFARAAIAAAEAAGIKTEG